MAKVEWGEQYRIGINAFDNDHHILVDLINELHDALEAGSGQRAKQRILSSLESYVETHFSREELMMSLYDYPKAEPHIAQHRHFADKVGEARRRFEDGDDEAVSHGLLGFLEDWLKQHVATADRQYIAFFEAVIGGRRRRRPDRGPLGRMFGALGSACVTVRGRLYAVTLILAAAMIGLAAFGALHMRDQTDAMHTTAKFADRLMDQGIVLLKTIKEIQIDVVQVQQWLSDISATRGRDGLDDGFDQAAKFARKFADDAARARALAGQAGLSEIAAAVARVETAFKPYLETGRAMAKAYVAEGPAAGNKLMGGFDEVAEKLQVRVEGLVALVERESGRQVEGLSALVHEIAADNEATARGFLVLAVVGVLLCAVGMVLISRIVKALSAITLATNRSVFGDHESEIPHVDDNNEIGDIAMAVNAFRKQGVLMEESRLGALEAVRAACGTSQKTTAQLAADFEKTVKAVVRKVSAASGEMKAAAETMSATAEETSRQSAAVAAASDQAAGNVQTVAAAAEELAGSVTEIGRQVGESTRIAGDAVVEAERTNSSVNGLNGAAQKIGDVVDLINDIASQTNLLALNATIEAARAGEAGKGFAVVASEVKNLATQTAKATDEIGAQIASMQEETTGAVDAIKGIGATIGKISEIATAISAAVEQQGAATGEISRNVQEAAQGTGEVSNNITGVSQAATETGQAVQNVLKAADSVSEQSNVLHDQVEVFLERIRAA